MEFESKSFGHPITAPADASVVSDIHPTHPPPFVSHPSHITNPLLALPNASSPTRTFLTLKDLTPTFHFTLTTCLAKYIALSPHILSHDEFWALSLWASVNTAKVLLPEELNLARRMDVLYMPREWAELKKELASWREQGEFADRIRLMLGDWERVERVVRGEMADLAGLTMDQEMERKLEWLRREIVRLE